jgi:hypothetical protein
MQGNTKLGSAIHIWSLPAIVTCPGSTELCRHWCYATSGRFRLESVKERLEWCYEQSLREDWVSRMVRELRRKGAIVVRVHVAGDFYSRAYAEKWLEVMHACPKVRYYWYSRVSLHTPNRLSLRC